MNDITLLFIAIPPKAMNQLESRDSPYSEYILADKLNRSRILRC